MSNRVTEYPVDDPLSRKSFHFAIRIVKLSKYLRETHQEYELAKQVIRSGTAIGALVREAKFAQSKPDFLHKLSIALKEAYETDYWLELLWKSDYLDDKMYQSIKPEITELLKILVSSTKTIKHTEK
ncbi:four helix bundle protein [Nitratifractor salsuginis]|uniref:CHP02436-containing protein n=1 Tax=Nitratifractor salsuginis (strain DSM 16511 / JCM 12458 / E9I37-1) TaxID=749222 RepID=E6X384_NITSE|nr:four helix bundle protein [Nitratifractor salsuginis]ADV47297.1 hypothetical protein Nitsa_2056 [Nitratifractor salsuginis DSM 16511]